MKALCASWFGRSSFHHVDRMYAWDMRVSNGPRNSFRQDTGNIPQKRIMSESNRVCEELYTSIYRDKSIPPIPLWGFLESEQWRNSFVTKVDFFVIPNSNKHMTRIYPGSRKHMDPIKDNESFQGTSCYYQLCPLSSYKDNDPISWWHPTHTSITI